jgi:hypothetical protein
MKRRRTTTATPLGELGSGNVFADLDLPHPEEELRKSRRRAAESGRRRFRLDRYELQRDPGETDDEYEARKALFENRPAAKRRSPRRRSGRGERK